jgi:predicted RNA-binding protein Jag
MNKLFLFLVFSPMITFGSQPVERKTVQDILDSIPYVDSRSIGPQPEPQSPVSGK